MIINFAAREIHQTSRSQKRRMMKLKMFLIVQKNHERLKSKYVFFFNFDTNYLKGFLVWWLCGVVARSLLKCF